MLHCLFFLGRRVLGDCPLIVDDQCVQLASRVVKDCLDGCLEIHDAQAGHVVCDYDILIVQSVQPRVVADSLEELQKLGKRAFCLAKQDTRETGVFGKHCNQEVIRVFAEVAHLKFQSCQCQLPMLVLLVWQCHSREEVFV